MPVCLLDLKFGKIRRDTVECVHDVLIELLDLITMNVPAVDDVTAIILHLD